MIIGAQRKNPRNRPRATRIARIARIAGIAALALAALGLATWYFVFWEEVVRLEDEVPDRFPASGFSHQSFGTLLRRFVTPGGRVRYVDWQADPGARAGLDRYLGALARYSPESTPERFGTAQDRLAYWINAYNACVIKGVLVHWPIGGVREVRAPIELRPGMGFFWRMHFVLGGRTLNLYNLENEVIRRRFPDARIHFLLNCASLGCPVLRPEAIRGPELERQLDEATRAFLETGVQVDPKSGTVTLSAILDWYREDFLAEAPSLLAWIRARAEKPLKSALAAAKGYRILFQTYDWNLNGA